MRWRRAAAAAPWSGWHSWEVCLLSLRLGVGWRFGLGALGPWIGDDVRRSDSGARTAQQQGGNRSRRRQETQCTGERRILQAMLCLSCAASVGNPRWRWQRGRPVGVDETNDGLQLVAPSIGLASRCPRPWRRERGELVSTKCEQMRCVPVLTCLAMVVGPRCSWHIQVNDRARSRGSCVWCKSQAACAQGTPKTRYKRRKIRVSGVGACLLARYLQIGAY